MTTDQAVFTLDNNTDVLLLDDEDDLRSAATFDQGHQFLNFSRKINESASMKRPVDIQLGIACGKNVLFSRSLLDNRKPPLHKTMQENHKNKGDYRHINSKVEVSNKSMLMIRKNQSKSNSLDRLVADVLKHIESCPDQTAYSTDLDRLKPKLEAYTLTRPTIQ